MAAALSSLSAGGAGASAAAIHSTAAGGAGASALPSPAATVAALWAEIHPAIEAYYRECPENIEESAKIDEVLKCAWYALNKIAEAGERMSGAVTLLKRKELESLPRTVCYFASEGCYNFCIFSPGKIGRGSEKDVKDAVVIQTSLADKKVTVFKGAVCIYNLDPSAKQAPSEAHRKAYIEEGKTRAKREKDACIKYARTDARNFFIPLLAAFSRDKISNYEDTLGMSASKVYHLHPRAYGDLASCLESIRLSDKSSFLKVAINSLLASAKALEYMHKEDIVHCDLKPSNILVLSEDDSRIADLTSTMSADDYIKFRNPVFTSLYTPPECALHLLHGRDFSIEPQEHDVWSLGMSILCIGLLYTGRAKSIFEAERTLMHKLNINGSKTKDILDNIGGLKQETIDAVIYELLHSFGGEELAGLRKVLEGTLRINQSERITMAEARALLEVYKAMLARG